MVEEIGDRRKKRLHVHVFETPKRSATASEAISGTSTASYMSGPGGGGPSISTAGAAVPNSPSIASNDTAAAARSAAAANAEKKGGKKQKQTKKSHIPMNEALAILEGRTPVYPKKKTLFQRILGLESVLRSDASLIALKTAAAVRIDTIPDNT